MFRAFTSYQSVSVHLIHAFQLGKMSDEEMNIDDGVLYSLLLTTLKINIK